MYSEREDYFFRARMYGDTRTLVTGDGGRLFGVLAAAIKGLRIGGIVHPAYKRSVLGRHMLRAWKSMERFRFSRGDDWLMAIETSPMSRCHARGFPASFRGTPALSVPTHPAPERAVLPDRTGTR
jgi:hypothetical protein